ncbi:hypothetical protein B9D02_05215 [Pantoea vagans]|nr:hypothetical protein [Pantoea vagans]AWP32010.1 hypothetical protein B9D02_05215 [Pantoea vagans]
MSESTELEVISITAEQAPTLYVENGLDQYLEQIRQAVNETPDLSTKKGRDRIASLAAKVSRSKTAIEKPGRDYLKRLKEQPKVIEAELRRFTTECDRIRDETRQPLTEWENAEKARVDALQQRIADLRGLAEVVDAMGNYLPSDDINARLATAKSVTLDDSWQELSAEAGVAKDATVQRLELSLAEAKKREDAAAELERLRKEQEAEAQRKRDEQLKREAAEEATRQAELKAQQEREAAAKREANLKAEAARIEQQRIDAERRAEQEKADAMAKAEREKQEAIDAERRRAAEAEASRLAEEKRIADETARRSADREHRRVINQQAITDLVAAGLTDEQAKACITAIVMGKIQAVTINY